MMMRRYGIAIDANEEFFRDSRRLLTDFLRNPALERNITAAQRAYAIGKQIDRLIGFYNNFAICAHAGTTGKTETAPFESLNTP